MNINDVKKIAVIGSGQMGHQIAMLAALGGFETVIQDISESTLTKAEKSLNGIMNKWVSKGKITEDAVNAAFARLVFSTNLKEAVQDADFVIEAVVEKLEVKRSVFKELDTWAPKHAILATNSSTIVNSLIAEVTERPEKMINMHFFFPPLVMDCVEVVMSSQTSEETAKVTMEVCERMNRTAVLLKKEISGFIANRILGALNKEAIYLYENGYADYQDIDLIVKKALGHPMGPFELMDFSGLDVVYFVQNQQYQESGNPLERPAKCLQEKVEKGELGRKTGKGFYTYEKEEVK